MEFNTIFEDARNISLALLLEMDAYAEQYAQEICSAEDQPSS